MSNAKTTEGIACPSRDLLAESVSLGLQGTFMGIVLMSVLSIANSGFSDGIINFLAFLSSCLDNPVFSLVLYALPILIFLKVPVFESKVFLVAIAGVQAVLALKLCAFVAVRLVVVLLSAGVGPDSFQLQLLNVGHWNLLVLLFWCGLLYSASLVFAVNSLFFSLLRKESFRPSISINT